MQSLAMGDLERWDCRSCRRRLSCRIRHVDCGRSPGGKAVSCDLRRLVLRRCGAAGQRDARLIAAGLDIVRGDVSDEGQQGGAEIFFRSLRAVLCSFDGAPVGDDSPEEQEYRQAIQIVAQSQKASTSWLQRQMRIGYNSAARLIERMEEEGLVGAPNHVGRREVLRDENGQPI